MKPVYNLQLSAISYQLNTKHSDTLHLQRRWSDDANLRAAFRAKRKLGRLKVYRGLWLCLVLVAFIGGYYYGSGDYDVGFQEGQAAESARVGKVIREKMSDARLSPFYLHGMDIRFKPRGSNIAQLEFLPTVERPDDPGTIPRYARVRDGE